MNNKVLSVLVVLALVVGGVAFLKGGPVGPQGNPGKDGVSIKGDKGDPGSPGRQGNPGRDGKDGLSLGASAGPDDFFPYKGLNNVKTFSTQQKWAVATTTTCAVQAPRAATSTLTVLNAVGTTATTTAGVHTFTWTRQVAPYGTTSASVEIASSTLGSNKLYAFDLFGSTTVFGDFAEDNFDPAAKELVGRAFAPGEWVVLTQLSGNNDGAGLDGQPHGDTGYCNASFVTSI